MIDLRTLPYMPPIDYGIHPKEMAFRTPASASTEAGVRQGVRADGDRDLSADDDRDLPIVKFFNSLIDRLKNPQSLLTDLPGLAVAVLAVYLVKILS